MGLHPGAQIGANVRLLGPLSRGGMGSVWRAEHLTLHTEVAVKFVSDALIGDQGFLARFKREAVASARIKSPHAVQIFDHGVTADGVPYIVMELLEGEDLRTRLLREKKLSLTETSKLVTQVARGLSRAHAASIVHRDIKPGNIFLMEQDGELFVKILDFGIAKQIGDVEQQVTMTGQIIGTPHYVSPEQIQRPRDADPMSDLWSLAVVAYRCLCGELPFEGESVGAVAIAIDKAAYAPITTREPSLPRMLDVWFGRAFARAQSARFGSAKELALAFEAASKDEPLPSALPEGAAFSLRTTGDNPIVSAAKLASKASDVTPGAIPLGQTEDDRATRPDTPPELAAGLPARAASPVAKATDTPMAMGEPTLSHGTVTHIELTHPRRTRLYGAVIAAVAIAGAITVGVLSRGDDIKGEAGAAAEPRPPDSTTSAQVTPASAAPPPVTATAQSPAATEAPGTSEPSAAPRPPPVKSASATATSAPTKKKKDRGF